MLNINESMWRDSATTTTMAKTPNAWGTSNDMAIPRRNQFSTANSNNVDPGSNPGPAINTNGVTGPASSGPPGVGPGGPGGPAGERLKFMFSADDMTESVLFGGPTQKIAGLEDAMDRLNMVIYKTISIYSHNCPSLRLASRSVPLHFQVSISCGGVKECTVIKK